MKFQKGILSEEQQAEAAGIKFGEGVRLQPVSATPVPERTATPAVPRTVEKDRLFETQEKVSSGSKHYLVVLGVVAVVVLIAGGVLYFVMQPGIGDEISTPKPAEAAVRDHFLTKEKRSATDMTFYKCDGFLWARVGVETRNDVPNPLMKIGTYKANVTTQPDGSFAITAAPISSPDQDTPCR